MQQISLKKIFVLIAGVIALLHLGEILDCIRGIFRWFGDRLAGFNRFPDDAQTAIAFCTLIAIIFIVLKAMKKL